MDRGRKTQGGVLMFVIGGHVVNRILDLCALVAGGIIAFTVLSISWGVFARYVLHSPVAWTLEINEYGLLFVTFLAAPWVLHHDKHVRVDLVLNSLKPRVRAGVMVWNSAVGVVVSLLIAYYGTLVTIDLIERGVHNSTLLEVPKGPLVAVVPFSCLLLGVEFLRQGLVYLRVARGIDTALGPHEALDIELPQSGVGSGLRGGS